MKDPIYTPGGLKVRLHEEGLARVLAGAQGELDLSDALVDTELWSNLPGAVSNVAAVTLAVATRSWLSTVVGALAAFIVAHLAQQVFYSHWMKVLFPQSLGGWLIALPASIGAAAYLWWTGPLLPGVIAVVVVLLNWLGVSDILLLILMPVTVTIRRVSGRMVGDTELAFISILNRQARQRGLELDWDRYSGT